MKLPNGTGSVYKMPGKRRNPWIARKTKAWDVCEDTGKAKQKYITVGYYHTRAEALAALMAYNADPYDLESSRLTFAEVYRRWSAVHFEKIVPSAQRTWVSAFNHSAPLHDMPMRDIRAQHLEAAIKKAAVGDSTKARMKSLYNLMYKYALKYEIVNKDYAVLCDYTGSAKAKKARVPFSEEEIAVLWHNTNFPFVPMVLIAIYSGWRPQELARIKLADVDLKAHAIKGGLKTDAGRNRVVPIHSGVYVFVVEYYNAAVNLGSDYLFNDVNCRSTPNLTYDKYRPRFDKIMKFFNMQHRPHDTRHTFITMAKQSHVDDFVLKLIVGHTIKDVTEAVYTHRSIEELAAEVEKIKIDVPL